MGIPDELTCLLRNLYAGQEATVTTLYGTTTNVHIVKVMFCFVFQYSCMNVRVGSKKSECRRSDVLNRGTGEDS